MQIKCQISIPQQDSEKKFLKNRWSSFEQQIDIVPQQIPALLSLLSTPAMANLQKNVINTGKKISSSVKAKKAKKDAELAALKANYDELEAGIRDTSIPSNSFDMHAGGAADGSDLNI